MTSQKRFRHQENSNSGSRSREVPPRFKRQKSVTNQTPLADRTASPPPSQFESNNSATDMTKLSNPKSSQPQMNRFQTGYENQHLSVQDQQASMYSNYSPSQMWAAPGYLSQPVLVHPTAPLMLQAVPMVNPVAQQTQNQNYAPYYMSPCWASPYHSSNSSPAPSPAPNTSSLGMASSVSPLPKQGATSDPQLSDPDLRVIKMLRELERFADEKETQEEVEAVADEGLGGDRKTLISHHTRMLMCAVDRYTQGLDDEDDDFTDGPGSRNGDGGSPSPTTSPVTSPPKLTTATNHIERLSPVYGHSSVRSKPPPVYRQSYNKPPMPVYGKGATQFQADYDRASVNKSTAEPLLRKPTPTVGNYAAASANQSYGGQSFVGLKQVPRDPWANAGDAATGEWNLWSSPSFDLSCGLVGYPPHCSGQGYFKY